MTESRKVQLEATLDATGVKAGANEVKREVNSMAQAVGQSAKEAGKAVDSIGNGSDASAKKVDAATKSMIQSIQRTTALMEAGSRTSSKYFETLASQRGVEVSALRPYLDQLDAIAGKQKAAQQAISATNPAMQQLGLTAKQTSAALRQVPAQFTDIIVSLQGGQAPMTVLLQQGGQLKDVFGGIGPAAKALGGYVLGLVNPFTLAAAAGVGLAVAYNQGSKEADAYAKSLILTGNAAGTSVNQLQAMATRIDAVVGTQSAAAEALAQLAGTGRVASRNLEEFTIVALRMEREVGVSISETVKNFEALGKSPVESSLRLNEQYRYLTASIYEQIKALEAQGKAQDAAALAQNSFADALTSRTNQIESNLGAIERAWRSVTSGAKEAWDAMLGVGRKKTIADQISDVASQIESHNQFSLFGPNLGELKDRQAGLQEMLRLEQRGAEIAGKRAAIEQAGVAAVDAVTKANEKGLSKQEQMNKALDDYRSNLAKIRDANPDSALLDPARIAKTEAAIRDQYKERVAAVSNAGQTEIANIKARVIAEQQYLEQLKLHGIAADKLNEGQKLALQYEEQLKGVLDAKSRAQKESALAASRSLASVQSEVEATKELLRSQEEFQKARDKEASSLGAEIVKIQEKAQAIEDEIAMYGLGREAIDAIAISRLEEKRAALIQFDGSEERISLLDKEIEARKRLAKAIDAKEVKSEAAKAAEDASRAWKKSADDIERWIGDALQRGFEGGKSFLKSLIDSIKSSFARLILSPIIRPIAGMGASFLNPNAPQAGGMNSLFQGASLVDAGKTLWSAFSGGMSSTIGGGIAGLGNLLGSSALGSFGAGMQGASLATGLAGPTTVGAGGAMGAGAFAANAIPYAAAAIAAATIAQKAFGIGKKEVTATGIQGSFNGEGFTGANFEDWKRKGGWLRSGTDGITWSDINPDLERSLAVGFDVVKRSTKEFAKTLGIESGSLIDNFSESIRVELTNNKEENEKLIARVFSDLGGHMAEALIPDLQRLRLEGEESATTLQRLATEYRAVDVVLATLGKTSEQAFGVVGIASIDARERLIGLAGGIDALVANTAFFAQNFLPDEDKAKLLADRIDPILESLGWKGITTVEDFAKMVKTFQVGTEAGDQALAKAYSVQQDFLQFANLTSAAVAKTTESLKKTLTDSYSALQRAVDAERKTATKQYEDAITPIKSEIDKITGSIGDLSNLSATLRNTVNSMRLPSMLGADRAEAQAQISGALAIARSGGPLPDADSLAGALNVVSQPSEQLFSTFVDFQRDFLKTKSSIAELAGLSDSKLSIEESTLKTLEDQLKTAEQGYADEIARLDGLLSSAQMQVDAINGVNTTLLSLPEAIANFNRASIGAGGGVIVDPGAGAMSADQQFVESLYTQFLGRASDAGGKQFYLDQLAGGLSTNDVINEILNSPEYKSKIPGFASGGLHAGGWRIVGEDGPEVEATGPSRIFSAAQTAEIFRGKSDNSILLVAIERTNLLLENISAETRATAQHSNGTKKILQRVVPDGDAIATRAEA